MAFIMADRAVTFYAGLITVGLIFISIGGSGLCIILGNEGNECTFEKILSDSFKIGCVLLVTGIFTLYLTFIVTRRDSKLFSKLLTDTFSTPKLLKIISTESFRLISKLHLETDEKIFEVSGRMRINYDIIEELKLVIAERLFITPRVLCDEILRFSPSLARNRLMKKAINIDKYKVEHLKKHAPNELSKYESFYESHIKQNAYIDKYCNNRKEHLLSIISSDLKFEHIKVMLQTQSGSAAILHLASILENNPPQNYRDYKLLYRIQKSFRDGFLWQRLLALSIIDAKTSSNNRRKKRKRIEYLLAIIDKSSKDEFIKKNLNKSTIDIYREFGLPKTLLYQWGESIDVIKSIIVSTLRTMLKEHSITHPVELKYKGILRKLEFNGFLLENRTYTGLKGDYKKDWAVDISNIIVQQRNNLIDNFKNEVLKSKDLDMIFDSREISARNKVRIVTSDYSRTIRSVFKKAISNPEFYNTLIFFITENDDRKNFGSRLTLHQLIEEQYNNPPTYFEGKELTDDVFAGRTMYGSSDLLHHQLAHNEELWFFMTCDEIQVKMGKVIAFSRRSPEEFKSFYDLSKKKVKVTFFIFVAEYNYNLQALARAYNDTQLINKVSRFDPNRTDRLYKWGDEEDIEYEVKIIRSDTLGLIK